MQDKMETQGQMHVEQGIQSQDMMRVLSSEKVLKMQETHNINIEVADSVANKEDREKVDFGGE